MILAKVVKRVVATEKLMNLPQTQILECEPFPGFGDMPMIALDGVGAGPGDTVLVLQEGTGAREVLLENPKQPMPAQMVIVGIVDDIDLPDGM